MPPEILGTVCIDVPYCICETINVITIIMSNYKYKIHMTLIHTFKLRCYNLYYTQLHANK